MDARRRLRSQLCRRLCLWGTAVLVLCALLPAWAGQDCTPRRPTLAAMARDLDLAVSVAAQLDELAARDGLRVALLARIGQDLSAYGLRYTHLGFVYRDTAALDGRGAWRVVHKLNQCGSDRAQIYRQGLAEFFGDGLFRHEAGLLPLKDADALAPLLTDNALLALVHEPRYNMLAYPCAGPYQQSNQWVIETLAVLRDPHVNSRAEARAWLRGRGYQPATVPLSAATRLGARMFTAHISFDDHPFGRRMEGQIDTVTVESVFAWLTRTGLGEPPMALRIRPPTVRARPGRPERAPVPAGASTISRAPA